MKISELIETLETIAPPSYAEEWDNVGLLVGRRDAELRGPTLLAIDFTEAVLEEAGRIGAGAVIAYHPTIFNAVRRIESDDPRSRVLIGAIEAGIAIYSPHTAIDAAPGGVTDWLCDMLAPEIRTDDGPGASFGDRRALCAHTQLDPRQTHKLVTFVPAEHAEVLRNALASVGAGRIGEYELCTFNIPGHGTFRGRAGTNPAIGESEQLETVQEIRMELVCPGDALGLVTEIIRQFHPYEEPPWDIYPLTPKPDRSIGAGRRLVLDQAATPRELALRLKKNLGVDAVKIAQASDEPIDHIGVCPGAGVSLLEAAMADGCRAFVTGEMRHHEAAAAVANGCSIILAGHTNTERGYLPLYAEKINAMAPEADARVSEMDRTLFRTL